MRTVSPGIGAGEEFADGVGEDSGALFVCHRFGLVDEMFPHSLQIRCSGVEMRDQVPP